jgi:hypothetical protein
MIVKNDCKVKVKVNIKVRIIIINDNSILWAYVIYKIKWRIL